jgi:hypothetical protein
MFRHKINVKIPHLNKIITITIRSLTDRSSPPAFTVKKLKRLYLGEFPFSVIRSSIVVSHATTLTGAISSVREHVIYSDWSDELPVH